MDRFGVGEPERFAEMVSAADAGVEVEITRDGTVVARVVGELAERRTDGQRLLADLAEIRKLLPPEVLGGGDATGGVRAMRDEEW